MALLYGSIGIFHIVFRKKFLLISLDPERAEASGIRVRLWDILFYMSFGVVITKSVAIVGVLLVFSYLVVPAVIAQMWCESVRARLLLGWLVAILASTAGIVWSFYSDYPTGPAVVVMLGIFLIMSSIVYYIRHAPAPGRAVANVAAMVLFGVLFISGLAYFKKTVPASSTPKGGPVDLLLNALAEDDEAHQLDAARHLGDMHDSRIVPALTNLLMRTKSEQVVEATVEALSKQQDPRAIPALRHAAQGKFDPFLKLSIARAQMTLGDKEGFATLIEILKNEEAAFARQQALELFQTQSGRKFGYDPEQSVAANAAAIERIEEWYRKEAGRLAWDKKSGKFQ
ncbi:MAG: hypothetical protein AUI33_11605 [Ignavibacteria bacterium 13_1_40CM_2_61_4]|nr:MAG: hypothetical protein AUI33_11605 [Ignavibacteria bacterium 13_1_40CM_2_61_4]